MAVDILPHVLLSDAGGWQFVQLRRQLNDPPRESVGVVADVKSVSGAGWGSGFSALASPAAPTMYVPAAQMPMSCRPCSDMVRSAEPRLPFIRFETMTQPRVPSVRTT